MFAIENAVPMLRERKDLLRFCQRKNSTRIIAKAKGFVKGLHPAGARKKRRENL
jgi:hypothetical protein